MLLWLSLAVACCLSAHAQPQYGGPVQFAPAPPRGPPASQPSRGGNPSAFQAPRFASPQTSPVFVTPPQGFQPIHTNQLGPSTPSPILLVTPQATTSGTRSQTPAQQRTQASIAQAQQQFFASPQFASPSPTPQARRPAPPPQQASNRGSYQKGSTSSRGSQRAGPELEDELLDDEELEEQKPDRLTELLPHSKFSCSGKQTGYYADEGLACEVFHYCQEGAKHSWICPDGFTFHQVHLICMPPSHDNICQKSSEFFFVNDYLYRPLNEEEARSRPNVTLRYSDRYYPENDPSGTGEIIQREPAPQRPAPSAPRRQPAAPVRQPQVFHSPESVNIPLQARRAPTPAPTPQRPQFHEQDEYEYDDFPYRQQG